MELEIRAPEASNQASEDITEATVMCWKKKDGDIVDKGDVLCEVEFGKAVVEVQATESGTLKIAVEEGDMVPAGEIIGYIQN